MIALETVTLDPFLRLKMSGCYVRKANDFGEFYFYKEANVSLREAVLDRSECLCKILGGANAYLEEFCPIETAYKDVMASRAAAPELFVLGYKAETHLRKYDIFRIDSKSTPEPELMDVRMLPFPRSMKLRVHDVSNGTGARPKHLRPLPHGVFVEVAGILSGEKFTQYDLHGDVLDKLLEAQELFDAVLGNLYAGMPPREAWLDAIVDHTAISVQVPASVTDVLLSASTGKDRAINEINGIWSNALDAPVLATRVYARINEMVDGDVNLAYAPDRRLAPREYMRYNRVRTPAAQLDEMDSCLYRGWLPIEDDSAERDQVRDEIHSFDTAIDEPRTAPTNVR